ncbi:hypothetical protein KXW51_003889 [Aspergillus fumigatus]|nr:hypothetical protein KXW47_006060 [Aspergillus fumigatus]KAH2037081.1 hypothetical protein KXW51_003889 [Aspergillus fumigatus]
MQGSQTVQGSQAAQGSQATQGGQTTQGRHGTHSSQAIPRPHAWLWGPDPGTGREWSSERFWEPSTAFPQNVQEAEPPTTMDADAKEHMDYKQ